MKTVLALLAVMAMSTFAMPLEAAKEKAPCGAAAPAVPVGADACSTAAGFATHLASCGCPYVWGGTDEHCCVSKGGLDCSGLTYSSYGLAGTSIPRNAADQYNAGFGKVSCSPSSVGDCAPGDLMFYCFEASCPSHVAMYVGGGNMAECPTTGENCHIVAPYANGFYGARSPCGGRLSENDRAALAGPDAEKVAMKLLLNYLRMNHLQGRNATVATPQLASLPCDLCEKAVGFLEGTITKVGCDFAFDAVAAAACEAAGLGPEDPLSDVCVAAMIGSCTIILKLVEDHVTSTSHICAAIHLC